MTLSRLFLVFLVSYLCSTRGLCSGMAPISDDSLAGVPSLRFPLGIPNHFD